MDSKLDYIDIASQIYTRLEMEYGFATPKSQNDQMPELWHFLASQLARHDDMIVLSWEEALDKISDEGKEFPPKIPKLLMTMRRCARLRTERSDDLVKYLQVKQNA
jgi:hypothetical protein